MDIAQKEAGRGAAWGKSLREWLGETSNQTWPAVLRSAVTLLEPLADLLHLPWAAFPTDYHHHYHYSTDSTEEKKRHRVEN